MRRWQRALLELLAKRDRISSGWSRQMATIRNRKGFRLLARGLFFRHRSLDQTHI
ncbi:protein of unknown function [Nitrospira japonica]|uniref:Uncharacterized protein n=1 Tax=Nitrospira japonica TaxID=1325564 RepID=A0A1W1IA56_9BACT|nr:protein of unknown function [Nitrospira japonica]